MTPTTLAQAQVLVLAWVRAYTARLPADVRDRRREEVAADVWEQSHEAMVRGASARALAAHVLLRWLRGVPADLTWRVDLLWATLGRWARRREEVPMSVRWANRLFFSAGGLLTAFCVYIAVANLVNGDIGNSRFWSVLFALCAACFGLGALLWRRGRTSLGGGVMVLGVAPIGLLFWWTIISPILALAMAGLGAWLWRRARTV